MDHFVAGLRSSKMTAPTSAKKTLMKLTARLSTRSRKLLDTRVRPRLPAMAATLCSVAIGKAWFGCTCRAACSGCPSSSATLKHGIENMLKHYVPRSFAVEQVDF